MLRDLFRLAAIAVLMLLSGHADAQQDGAGRASFTSYVDALWPDAQARGITPATFDLAFAGLTPDQRVVATTHKQPEFNSAIGPYINRMASAERVANGARKLAELSGTLDAIERQYGVDRAIIVAIWGIETSFGTNAGAFDVIRSLATLAFVGYREPYFREELLTALRVLQDGHIARGRMLGSWAGAMGQPQFMPSSFMALAVDFTGDGRKDIWTSVPDVLASIGHYFQHHGWKRGLDWGYEVVIPGSFDYRKSRATFPEWVALGVKRANGAPLPDAGDAILLFPSGASGPAFLVTENFSVIKRYNISDVFALAVAHLAERMRGRGQIRTPWPAADPQLSRADRIALQKRLAAMGYTVNDFDGRIDFDLRDAIRDVQSKNGMRPDGHPTALLLKRIGAKRD